MKPFAALLALLIGVAGWYYLFYSKAAVRLGVVEEATVNQRRQRLRRINGGIMVALAGLLYAGFFSAAVQEVPRIFILVWFGVFLLLLGVMVLAIVDLRLTAKLRKKR